MNDPNETPQSVNSLGFAQYKTCEALRLQDASEVILVILPGNNGAYPQATLVDPLKLVLKKVDGHYQIQLPVAFVGQLSVLNAVGTIIATFDSNYSNNTECQRDSASELKVNR